MALTVAVLESLFTANVKDFEAKASKVDATQKALDKADPTVKVKAETTGALSDMVKVETSAKKITATKVVAQVDADIAKAQKNASKIETDLKVLAALDVDPTVTADTVKAQAALAKVETRLTALRGARAEMVVVADVKKAEKSLDDVAGKAASAGSKGGKDAGQGLAGGIIAAIATIPIAGAVVGIGAVIGKSLLDGLQNEVRSDLLTARTGLDPKAVAVIARVSGEAYADNFGSSIAENMDTARAAVQGGLLDPKGTARDSQAIIESLSGVAAIIGEDIPRVSRSTTQLLRTGLAKDAAGAFDIIVKGTQAGLNVSEDFLDTLDEYSTQFRKLGLDGPMSLGLLSQAVKAGARDTDTAADALKEFAIRAVDGSKTTIAGFEGIGLSASDMAAKIVKGGPESEAALGLTLDKLRAVEDPTKRAALAVDLFGTKAEDLGDALYAMDTSTAVKQLGNVAGAAKSAVAEMGDNAAGSIASAQRNIETAADGIKGALATAFGPQIKGFSTFVTENRAAVMQFLLDMANGGIDAARAIVNGAADMTEGFGNFVGTAGPATLGFLDAILKGMDAIPGVDLTDSIKDFEKMRKGAEEGFASFDEGSAEAAAAIRTNLIENGLDPAQDKLNGVAIPMVAQAKLHDASIALAHDIDNIGFAADGSRLKIDTHRGSIDQNTDAGKRLDGQLRGMVASLDAEAAAGMKTGESQAALTARYGEGRQALINQLVQMGYTAAQAGVLADKYRAVPGKVNTLFAAEKEEAARKANAIKDLLYTIPTHRGVRITADTGQASGALSGLRTIYNALSNKSITVSVAAKATSSGGIAGVRGTTVAFQANGGHVQAANGMDRQSMIAPGGANITWAEPETGWETYISGKPSQRARNIKLLEETGRRFGLAVIPTDTTHRADGGGSGSVTSSAMPSLSGLAIEGTLDLGNGLVGMLRGVVRSELAAEASAVRQRPRR